MRLLSATLPKGIIAFLFLFVFCFFLVHTARLARIGWKYQRKKPPKPPEKSEEKRTPPPTPPEPVYYIVEKKRKSRTSYSAPKEIRFK